MKPLSYDELFSHLLLCDYVKDICKNIGCNFEGLRKDLIYEHELVCEYGEPMKNKIRASIDLVS